MNAASLDKMKILKQADRIGISGLDVLRSIDLVKSAGGTVEGLHVYLGTNFPRSREMLILLKELFTIAKQISGIKYINIGGGMGLDYAKTGEPFDIQQFGASLSTYLGSLEDSIGHTVKLIFEPGRGLIGDCGVFLVTVTDRKLLGEKNYVAVNASVAQFPRPFHQPESPHYVRPLRSQQSSSESRSLETTIVGRTTFSRDILASCPLPESIACGDVLLFEDSGAYCDSMRSSFLGQESAGNIYFRNGVRVLAENN